MSWTAAQWSLAFGHDFVVEFGVSRQTLYRQTFRQTAKLGRMARGCSPESRGPKRPTDAESRILRPITFDTQLRT